VSVGIEQRGFVGLWQPHLRAQNIAANVSGIGAVVALMNFLSQSALQAWDVGGKRGLFCSLSVRTKTP
jgi:hypothetical protein